jgi:proteasome accessory factor B
VVLLLGARTPVPFREIRSQFRAYRSGTQKEAGLRAFERDKADLIELGVPIRFVQSEDEASQESGYVIDLRSYRLPDVHLTPDEVAALVLAGSVARAAPGTTYAEVVDLALKKLAFDLPAPPDSPGAPVAVAQRPREPVLVHFPNPVEAAALAENLAKLEHSIANRKRITIRYLSASAEQTTRDVDPYGLFYREGSWYLVGWCHKRTKVLSFRCDRILDMKEAAKPKTPDFERPDDFDVRRHAARSAWTFENEPAVDAELEIRPDAAAVANEDFGPGSTRSEGAGGVIRVKFRCANPDYVVERVLENKGGLLVRAPESLRARVRSELERVAEVYR